MVDESRQLFRDILSITIISNIIIIILQFYLICWQNCEVNVQMTAILISLIFFAFNCHTLFSISNCNYNFLLKNSCLFITFISLNGCIDLIIFQKFLWINDRSDMVVFYAITFSLMSILISYVI
jgi:hypothetical protein